MERLHAAPDVKVIFIKPMGRLEGMFADLDADERVTVLHGPCRELKSRVLRFIRAVHLNSRVNKCLYLPFKHIWSYSLRSIDWKIGVRYLVVIPNSALYPISTDYLNELKNKYDISYMLYMLDAYMSPNAKWARYYLEKVKFDCVFTFDSDDARTYGFYYSDTHYSLLGFPSTEDIRTDVYFAGLNKGRLELLHSLYHYFLANSVKSLFRIGRVSYKEKHLNGIIYNKRVSYIQMLKEESRANCILEVPSSGQTGATTRYFEAVCYNKKLLTTNNRIADMPFYDERYIHIFERPEDIDCDWVKERVQVDYGYDGRFSPTYLVDRILQIEQEKRGGNGRLVIVFFKLICQFYDARLMGKGNCK